MSGFLDIRFPTDISYGSAGGPAYHTTVVVAGSGKEKRDAKWDYPKGKYDVAYGVKDADALYDLLSFFHVVWGKAYTFRFKDHSDYKSCSVNETPAFDDQSIGTGDGATKTFQLQKSYLFAGVSRKARKITKPVSGTVSVGINGVKQDTSAYSVNYTTGEVTFDTTPSDGANVTAGFEFDLECRFDTDELSTNLQAYKAWKVQVPVIEDNNDG